jgi:hypothetical protein
MRDSFDSDFMRYIEGEGEALPSPTLKTPVKRKAVPVRRKRTSTWGLDLLEQIGKFIGLTIGKDVKALEARVAALEESKFRFLGAWSEGLQARAGNAVAHDGSTWIAVESTTKRPGTDNSGWILAAKRGRDARSR